MGELGKVDHPWLAEVQHLSISNVAAQKKAVQTIFWGLIKKRPFSALFLSITTLGIYPIALRRKARRILHNALAARKINHYQTLLREIEAVRSRQEYTEPRLNINTICKEVMGSKTEGGLTYNQIFSSSDLFLFISTPPTEEKIDTSPLFSAKPDYYKAWTTIKKAARAGEFCYIKSINSHYTALQKRFDLSEEEINERLARTTVCQEGSGCLTKLRHLSLAFTELTEAFHAFAALEKTDPELYKALLTLFKASLDELDEETKSSLRSADTKDLGNTLPLIFSKEKLSLLGGLRPAEETGTPEQGD